MKASRLTTHVECDVPDEYVGTIQRFLAGLKTKGVDNVTTQPNGTTKRNGEMPSRMNEGKTSDVVLALVQTRSTVTTTDIKKAMDEAGFSGRGAGSVIHDLIKKKMIKRVGYATYSAPKALPSPSKKKEGSGG